MTEQAHATVDARRDSLIVASYSLTTAGFWLMNGAFQVLDQDVADEVVGEAVRDALGQSRTDVAVPDWSVLPIAPILAALGLKSFAAYVKGTKQVGVSVGESTTLTPTRNAGAREGFVEIEDASASIARDPDPAVLGGAIRHALLTAQ